MRCDAPDLCGALQGAQCASFKDCAAVCQSAGADCQAAIVEGLVVCGEKVPLLKYYSLGRAGGGPVCAFCRL